MEEGFFHDVRALFSKKPGRQFHVCDKHHYFERIASRVKHPKLTKRSSFNVRHIFLKTSGPQPRCFMGVRQTVWHVRLSWPHKVVLRPALFYESCNSFWTILMLLWVGFGNCVASMVGQVRYLMSSCFYVSTCVPPIAVCLYRCRDTMALMIPGRQKKLFLRKLLQLRTNIHGGESL